MILFFFSFRSFFRFFRLSRSAALWSSALSGRRSPASFCPKPAARCHRLTLQRSLPIYSKQTAGGCRRQLADRLAAATAEAANAAAASEEERARLIKTLHSAALCAVRCCAPGDKALRALIARAAAALSRLPRERFGDTASKLDKGLKSLSGGGVPSSHPSLGSSRAAFFLFINGCLWEAFLSFRSRLRSRKSKTGVLAGSVPSRSAWAPKV